MPRPHLTLYLDVVSPFAYLAFHFIRNSPAFKQCDVKFIPIFLGGVMKATGNRPPIAVKNKGIWMGKERFRWAKYANAPIAAETPKGFPANTIAPMRALCAIEASDPQKLTPAFDALYKAYWVEGKPVDTQEVYSAALVEALGEDGARKAIEAIGTPEVKQRLVENTDKALASGAFGLPWFEATNTKGEMEVFWGFDHMGQIMDHLGLKRDDKLHAML